MNQISIRRATSADLGQLRAFEQALITYERGIEPTLKQMGELKYYDLPKLIDDNENAHVLVAEFDGRPAGCGLGLIKPNADVYTESKYGYVGLVYVDPNFRRHHIASQIMDELMAWFKGREIREVRLQVYAGNIGAIEAYQRYGFEYYILELKKST